MIKLEQVQLLESRVEKALALIDRLKGENLGLRDKLTGYQKRIEDLEALVRGLQSEQGRIEEGILSALSKLNRFEDGLEAEGRVKDAAPEARAQAPRQEAAPAKPEAPKAEAPKAEAPKSDTAARQASTAGADPVPSGVPSGAPEHPELEIF